MIELAHNFGSKASAVGIETDADAQALAGLGCDYGQGYLFAKPMTDEELMALVVGAGAEPKGVGHASNKNAAVVNNPP
jgi:EAL domain-containing protein (putative c-di-GMP-specific phosphodiesterase class I)